MEQFSNVPSYKLVSLSKQNDTLVVPTQQRNYVPILLFVILGLLVINTGLLGYILLLPQQLETQHTNGKASTLTPQSNTEDIVNNTVAKVTDTYNNAADLNMQQDHETQGLLPQGINQETVREMVEKSPYSSILSKSLDQAEDAKKRADLNSIGTVMNIYMMEQDGELPDTFPESLRCIGTDTGCFDLYSLLVPVYIEKPIVNTNGTLGNTGYLIGKSTDGISTVVLQATGEDGSLIEVRK